MGTKIQANTYIRECRSLIDLDASTSNAMNEKWLLENGKHSDSLSSYDTEKVRQTILEHELTFRNQLRELHRLHGRQQELMNESKRRGINRDGGVVGDKFQLSCFFSPFPAENAKWKDKRSLSSYDPRVLNNIGLPSESYNLGFPANSMFPIVECISQKRNHGTACDRADKFSLSAAAQTSQLGADVLTFSISKPTDGLSATLCPNLNLVTKDFFHDSRGRMRNERSGNEHPFDDHADKRRSDKHSSARDLFSGKSLAFPQSLLAEPRKEFPKKIFGVEICEGNDDSSDLASYMSSNHVRALESPSLVADSFVQNLKLQVANWNDGENERSKADTEGEILSQKRSSCHGKWLEGDFKTYFKNVDNTNNAAEVLKKDPEHSQKPREMIPKHPMLADCQSNQENPKGSLPWFCRNSRVSTDLNNATKSPYFMNLDSLQICSQKFFGIAEMPHGSKQRKEAEVEINQDQQILTENVLDKGLKYMSDLRHCIDLNLSLDDDDASSAPSLPSPEEIEPSKSNVLSGNTGLPYQECDKSAAEAMIAISLVDEFNSLKWFAEVVSSKGNDHTSDDDDDDEQPFLDGMDYFEFLTLKLEDTKEEHYCPEPLVLKAPSDEKTGTALTKRTRRGQRRDFQRDILPGLATLSRLEVTEDLQAFEELLKAGDSRSSTRNGRGRMKRACSTEAQQPVCQIEERSLAGWGKKTRRRLPRQRCPNAFHSFPLKC